jgi:acyl transferase domain-containing protein
LTPLVAEGRHRVSINSFGYGGTNGHVILESAPDRGRRRPFAADPKVNSPSGQHSSDDESILDSTDSDSGISVNTPSSIGTKKTEQFLHSKLNALNGADSLERSRAANSIHASQKQVPKLFVLTAKSENSLRANIEQLGTWLCKDENQNASLQDISYTLALGRSKLQWRYSFAATSHDDLAAALDAKFSAICKTSYAFRVVFLFNGQGAQWYGMGRELIHSSPIFKNSITKSDHLIRSWGCSWSLLEELLVDEHDSRINESELSQPICTAIQIAIVDQLRNVGIKPQTVVGHSSGEIAAAYACHILSHEDSMKM